MPASIRLPVLGSSPAASAERARQALASDLRRIVRGQVRFDRHDRLLYATDASIYQVEPLGLVVPADIDDAIALIRFCARRGIPMLPRGGGTSLAGQCTAQAVIIDFSAHCHALRDLDVDARRCRVEPGITIDQLNHLLRPHRLFFAPDPATTAQANIGGCIGNNAAGARSIRYGRTSENLIGLDVCLADGQCVRLAPGSAAHDPRARQLTRDVVSLVRRFEPQIRQRYPTTLRRNAGYALDLILAQLDALAPAADAAADDILAQLNLAPLLCGSEGTLAITLLADLRLHPCPRAVGLALISFASLDEAIDAVVPILSTRPSAVELIDDVILALAAAHPEHRAAAERVPRVRGRTPAALLFVEYLADDDPAQLTDQFATLARLLPGTAIRTYQDEQSMSAAWSLRRAGEPLLHTTSGARKPLTFVEDAAVPPQRLREFVHGFRRILADADTTASFWAHASVGLLHVRPLLNLRDPADERRMHRIAVEVADLARALGGVTSGEHGDGRARGPFLERYFGRDLLLAFRQLKAIFDPAGLLNPGAIVDPGPVESISQHTRIRPAHRPVDFPPTRTFFDYADQDGLRGAVERCNGAGVCRRLAGGTMCPSFRGTRDERHATRGRANALRLALTGQLSPARWGDTETLRTLDLCLGCKACKRECPSAVDMARLKSEYLAQTYRRRGRAPLHALAFGHIRLLHRLGSLAPSLANRVLDSAPLRGALQRALHLSPQRSLPRLARPLARSLPRASPHARAWPARPRVLLFADCFTAFSEPWIGEAAARSLEAFGYRVELADVGCCGRSMISMGLLGRAATAGDRVVSRLLPLLRQAEALLFVEPSCLSAVVDDWPVLRMRAPLADRRMLAQRSTTAEDFLARNWSTHPCRPQLAAPAGIRRLLLHPHCHQRALWGTAATESLVARIPDLSLEVLDAGCCGMAGAFGFTADHFDLSMRIGELALFPAVRNAADDTIPLAPGTSCRHQIRDGTGCEPLHPIELVDRAVRAANSPPVVVDALD